MPWVFYAGRELQIESANDELLRLWGKSAAIIGQRLEEVLPELKEQTFINKLTRVLRTGQPYYGQEEKAIIERQGEPAEGYYNFVFQPVKYKAGNTTGVMIVANDVTYQCQANKLLTHSNNRLN